MAHLPVDFLGQLVNEPTRARGTNTPSLLDLVLTNEEALINSATTEAAIGKSGHVVLQITANFNVKDQCPRARRNYDKPNYTQMRSDLSINWIETLSNMDDVSTIWAKFEDLLTFTMDTNIPTISAKARKYRYPLEKKTRTAINKNRL